MTRFKYFVIFAEMRTGSNLLESGLNALEGVSCFGELFNRHFIGGPKRESVFGITLGMREEDPMGLVRAMRNETDGLPGFRLFHDHDPRIINAVIDDPECAKIILTRNPVDAFVSRKIAGMTGQWKLGDAKDRKDAEIHFEMSEFEEYLSVRQEFQSSLRRKLQVSGQMAFSVTYDDIQSVDVINGLAKFLGISAQLEQIPSTLKKQNPAPLADKIKNSNDVSERLKGFEWIDLEAAPNFEPERGPGVPRFLAGHGSGLLYLPIDGGPTHSVTRWMEALDGKSPTDGHSQKTLRKWMGETRKRRVFTVLRHPVERAYHAFLTIIVLKGQAQRAGLRRTLETRYGLEIPGDPMDTDAMRNAFLGFLTFVESNLAGQTSVKTAGSWASQKSILDGMSKVVFPDLLIREPEFPAPLGDLAMTGPPFAVEEPPAAAPIGDIYNKDIELAARRAYRRDYQAFGFENWA